MKLEKFINELSNVGFWIGSVVLPITLDTISDNILIYRWARPTSTCEFTMYGCMYGCRVPLVCVRKLVGAEL